MREETVDGYTNKDHPIIYEIVESISSSIDLIYWCESGVIIPYYPRRNIVRYDLWIHVDSESIKIEVIQLNSMIYSSIIQLANPNCFNLAVVEIKRFL